MKVYVTIFEKEKERLALVGSDVLLYVKQEQDGKWSTNMYTSKQACKKFPEFTKLIKDNKKIIEDQQWTETFAG